MEIIEQNDNDGNRDTKYYMVSQIWFDKWLEYIKYPDKSFPL